MVVENGLLTIVGQTLSNHGGRGESVAKGSKGVLGCLARWVRKRTVLSAHG